MIGRTLNNRYTITARLGKGAMGTVYRATDTQSGRDVALKVISSELVFDSDMLERFKREGEALSKLKHPNIVEFLDAFQHEEHYVIVMEFVSGGSLHELISKGPLPVERANSIALELCDALIRSHHLNIIHRDLKPENVLIAEDGTSKLADFGVARLSEGTRMTRSGTQVGTPYYMAPEAWEGKTLDAKADIWSLGVILFEMLTGQVPFGGDTGAAVMNKVLTTQPPDLKKIRADVPTGLVKIISRMLVRDKNRRYQTMREVAVDIEHVQPSQVQTVNRAASARQKQFIVAGMVLFVVVVGAAALFGNLGNISVGSSPTVQTRTILPTDQSSSTLLPVEATATPLVAQATATPVCVSGSSIFSETLSKADTFSNPILSSLADIVPTFEDDFSEIGRGWAENRIPGAWESGKMEIVDGVLRFTDVIGQNLVDTGNWSNAQDFVFEIDQRLVEGFQTTEQRITFHLYPSSLNNYHHFSLQIYQKAGYWTFRKSADPSGEDIAEGRCTLNSTGEWNRITLIVKDEELAILINDHPAYYLQDPELVEPGFMHLICRSPAVAICEWDNVKFWNLDKLQ